MRGRESGLTSTTIRTGTPKYPARVAVEHRDERTALPGLGRLAGYNELLWTLFRREVRVRYRGSALGLVWSVIYPISMMLVYTLIFSVLWKTARNIPHYPIFVLVGLAVWGFFQASVQLGSGSLVAQRRADQEDLVPARADPGRDRARADDLRRE